MTLLEESAKKTHVLLFDSKLDNSSKSKAEKETDTKQQQPQPHSNTQQPSQPQQHQQSSKSADPPRKFTHATLGFNALCEMVFGSIPLAQKQSTKVHVFKNMNEVMLTHLFTLRVERLNSVQNFSGSGSANSSFSSKYPTSAPPTPKIYQSMDREALTSSGSLSKGIGLGSLAQSTEIKRLFGCVLLFRCDANTQFQLQQTDLRNFIFSHFMHVEWRLKQLLSVVQNILIELLKKGELQSFELQQHPSVKRAADEFQNSILELLVVQRHKSPVWLDLLTYPSREIEIFTSFLHNFQSIYNTFETPKKRIVSIAISTILLTHMSWVSSIPKATQRLDVKVKSTGLLEDQFNEIYGNLYSSRWCQIIVVCRGSEVASKFLNVLSYFIRWSMLFDLPADKQLLNIIVQEQLPSMNSILDSNNSTNTTNVGSSNLNGIEKPPGSPKPISSNSSSSAASILPFLNAKDKIQPTKPTTSTTTTSSSSTPEPTNNRTTLQVVTLASNATSEQAQEQLYKQQHPPPTTPVSTPTMSSKTPDSTGKRKGSFLSKLSDSPKQPQLSPNQISPPPVTKRKSGFFGSSAPTVPPPTPVSSSNPNNNNNNNNNNSSNINQPNSPLNASSSNNNANNSNGNSTTTATNSIDGIVAKNTNSSLDIEIAARDPRWNLSRSMFGDVVSKYNSDLAVQAVSHLDVNVVIENLRSRVVQSTQTVGNELPKKETNPQQQQQAQQQQQTNNNLSIISKLESRSADTECASAVIVDLEKGSVLRISYDPEMEPQFADGIIVDNVEAFSPFVATTLSSLYRLQTMGVSTKTSLSYVEDRLSELVLKGLLRSKVDPRILNPQEVADLIGISIDDLPLVHEIGMLSLINKY